MSREDFCSVLRVLCIFAGKYEKNFRKDWCIFMDFDYVQSVVMLEEESTPGRGPSKVSVLVEGATQG